LIFSNKSILSSDSPKKLVDSKPIPPPSDEEQEESVSYHPKKARITHLFIL